MARKIDPIMTKRGEWVEFNAKGTTKAMGLFFPDMSLFGIQVLSVPAGGKKRLQVLKSAVLGLNRYAVYFDEDRDFAEGASSPIIIVDR